MTRLGAKLRKEHVALEYTNVSARTRGEYGTMPFPKLAAPQEAPRSTATA
jgi:hypothetical protein